MSLMPSLCAALERVGGERLVMRAGERPHVLAGDRRHDVASAILSVNAVEALAEQILSIDGRRELKEKGAATETIQAASFPHPLMAKAERVGEEFAIELVVQKPAEEPAPSSEPEPVATEVLLLSKSSLSRRLNPSPNQSLSQSRLRLHHRHRRLLNITTLSPRRCTSRLHSRWRRASLSRIRL